MTQEVDSRLTGDAPSGPPPEALMMQMIFGKAITQAISVVARYRIADLLAKVPMTAVEIAEATGLHAGHLYRVLRALVGVNVLTADHEARFALTSLGEMLRSDVPGSMRPIATYVCDPWSWKPWGELAASVKSGQPVFDRMFGEGVFDYLGKHPEEAATFNEGMTGFSERAASAMLEAYDFSRFGTIIDVGGGHGAILTAILQKHKNVRGIVFDAPSVVEGAASAIQSSGLSDRLSTAAGNFFASVPTGGDLYLLKHIIHDWNDEKATAILKSCREAIGPQGRLMLVEIVVPPNFAPSFANLLDLEMMVICDGKERTEDEYRVLLAGAGFELTSITPTSQPHSLIEAVPI